MPVSVSSTTVAVSASRSCASREKRRTFRPKTTAASMKTGTVASMMPESWSEVAAMATSPTTRSMDCRMICATVKVSVS